MIRVDGNTVQYSLAVKGLAYDKLGHDTGLGSWGIVTEIDDGIKDEPLTLFVGLKFDVVSVITNRDVALFINIGTDIKQSIEALRASREIGSVVGSEESNSYDGWEHTITFYVDVHKIEIDVKKLAISIYEDIDTVEQYVALVDSKILKRRGLRQARYVSAHMQRTYDGNLENFSFIFYDDKVLYVVNEKIVDESMVSDEIKYTFWLTPHDREDFSFLSSRGRIALQGGSEIGEQLGYETITAGGSFNTQRFDRRMFRFGYYDVTTKDQIVNFGYTDDNTVCADTFIVSKKPSARTHLKILRKTLNTRFSYGGEKAVFNIINRILTSPDVSGKVSSTLVAATAISSAIKTIEYDGTRLKMDVFEELSKNEIRNALSRFYEQGQVSENDINMFDKSVENMFSLPIVALNRLHSFEAIDEDVVRDSVAFIFNPILKAFVFYEFDENDVAEIGNDRIVFKSNGSIYGIKTDVRDGVFIWNNIEKKFRLEADNVVVNAKGIYMKKEKLLAARDNDPLSGTDARLPLYRDLMFNGDYGKLLIVKKGDLKKAAKKTFGVLESPFILGMKTGYVNIARSGLWM